MRLRITIVFILLLLGYTSVVSQPCLPDGITFTTQSQIDSFPINYPGCTEIEGDVVIQGSDIKNLDGLYALTSVGGDFEIRFNDSLKNLSGLDDLVFVGNNLDLYGNVSLQHLNNLSNLTSVGYTIYIWGNSSLKNLIGLENIVWMIGLSINSNDSLTSLHGLEHLSTLGNLFIQYNSSLMSLSGLDNLEHITGELDINITSLTSLEGLNRLKTIGYRFSLTNNNQLIEVNALDSLNYIGDGVVLRYNNSLENISGLENLNSIGGYLSIHGCTILQSLAPLSNLTFIGGMLHITENDELYSLEGLQSIEPSSIGSLEISRNTNLTHCEVESVCSYLSIPNSASIIHSNSMGCNSREEVENACTVDVSDFPINESINIFPNPTTSKITISGIEGIIDEVCIYNKLGQRVIHEEKLNNIINVSNFSQGLYIIEVVWDEYRVRRKLIVQ